MIINHDYLEHPGTNCSIQFIYVFWICLRILNGESTRNMPVLVVARWGLHSLRDITLLRLKRWLPKVGLRSSPNGDLWVGPHGPKLLFKAGSFNIFWASSGRELGDVCLTAMASRPGRWVSVVLHSEGHGGTDVTGTGELTKHCSLYIFLYLFAPTLFVIWFCHAI